MKKITALGLAAGLFASAWAQEDKSKSTDPKLRQIMSDLERVIPEIDYPKEMTLDDAISSIRDASGLNIDISPKVAEKHSGTVEVGPLRLKNVRIKTVLKIMLGAKELTLSYREGILVVIPQEEVGRNMAVKVYDVRDLMYKVKDFPGPKVELVPPDSAGGTALTGAIFELEDEGNGSMSEDFLTELIKGNVGAQSWDQEGANIQLKNGRLIISNTNKIHDEIKTLLQMLRQFK